MCEFRNARSLIAINITKHSPKNQELERINEKLNNVGKSDETTLKKKSLQRFLALSGSPSPSRSQSLRLASTQPESPSCS
jgi:hypothetical protein